MYIAQLNHFDNKRTSSWYPGIELEIQGILDRVAKENGYENLDNYYRIFISKYDPNILFKFTSEVIFIAYEFTSRSETKFRAEISKIEIVSLKDIPIEGYHNRILNVYKNTDMKIEDVRDRYNKAIEYYRELRSK